MKQIGRLKVGENTFTIPAIVSKDFERGGSLYAVSYTHLDVYKRQTMWRSSRTS